MRVVESALAHFPKRSFDLTLIESIVDEHVVAPHVNKRVLFCANQEKQNNNSNAVSNTFETDLASSRQSSKKKKGDKHIPLLARVAHRV
jgi:hypothetical protein